jgi:hypothetical protein
MILKFFHPTMKELTLDQAENTLQKSGRMVDFKEAFQVKQ